MLLSNLLILIGSIAVAIRRDKSVLYNRTSSIIFTSIFFISIYSVNLLPISNLIGLFGGLFNINSMSYVFHIFILGITSVIIILSSVYSKIDNNVLSTSLNYIYKVKETILNNNAISNLNSGFDNKNEHFKIIEYSLIVLFIVVGATFLISSNDIVSIFISIELQSYGLYLLVVLYRNSELSTNAGLTYFLLGGLSSCFILLGTSILYSNSGITNLESIYIISMIWDSTKDYISYAFTSNFINYAMVVAIVGFLFKISSAPFHFWSPGVYDAIPTITTIFVAIIPKISILIFMYSLIHFTSSTVFSLDYDWKYTLVVSSLLSLIVGTVLGLNQSRIKRLYAYSTISHLGFILLALSINNTESIQSFIFYIMQYSLSNLNAFILLLAIGYTLTIYKNDIFENELIEKNYSPLQLIKQLQGYFIFNPFIAISLAITIYSFVGVPPLLGFFAKQMVLSAALDNGFVFMTIIAILTSVIGAVYYLNIIKQIFFDKFTYTIEDKTVNLIGNTIRLSRFITLFISVLTLIILLFMTQPQEWLSISHILSLLSINP